MLFRKRQPMSQPFTANGTWTAPLTTNSVSASGHGAPGSPSGSISGYNKTTITYKFYKDGSQTQNPVFNGFFAGAVPANYCDTPVSTPSDPFVSSTMVCYVFEAATQGYSATTGAAATAFDNTFKGGTGGAAPTTTFNNVPVTPGAPYNIVVPPGGSITITWLQ
jgi:hypothetical protein